MLLGYVVGRKRTPTYSIALGIGIDDLAPGLDVQGGERPARPLWAGHYILPFPAPHASQLDSLPEKWYSNGEKRAPGLFGPVPFLISG